MKALKEYLLRFRHFHGNARLFIYVTFASSMAQSAFGLVYNLYVLELGYTREFLGTLESIPVFVTAALAVPLALLCANLSMKRILLTAVALAALAFAGLSVFPSKPMLISFRFLSGVSAALMAITSWPLMARYSTENDRNFVFSFQFAFTMIAGFFGNLISGGMTRLAAVILSGGAESETSYRAALLASAGIMALSILPALRFEDPGSAGNRRGALDPSRLEPKRTFMVFLPQILVGFGAGMVMPYLNIFFKTMFDLRISSLGLLMSLMPLSMSLGGFVGPWLVKKRGLVGAMIILQALSVPFLATMGFSGLILPTVAAAFIRTMLMNASWPIYSVFMLSHFRKEDHPLASALYTAGWSLAWAFGTKLSGTLQMDFGFTMPFMITIVCYCAATLLLSRWFLRGDRRAAAATAMPPEAME